MNELDRWFGPKPERKRGTIHDIIDKIDGTHEGPAFPETEAMRPRQVEPDIVPHNTPEPEARPNDTDWQALIQLTRELRAQGKTFCVTCGEVMPVPFLRGPAVCSSCKEKRFAQFKRDSGL